MFLRQTFLSTDATSLSFRADKNSLRKGMEILTGLPVRDSWSPYLGCSCFPTGFTNLPPTLLARSRPLDRAGARIIRDPPPGQRSTRLRDPLQPSTLRATHRATTPTKRKWMARRLGRVRSKRDKPFDKRDHWGGNNPPPPRRELTKKMVEFLIYLFIFFFLLSWIFPLFLNWKDQGNFDNSFLSNFFFFFLLEIL